ncbi:uncharacterized protein AMSG_09463 [Thecamonas trahens ATCC 50062]|uniref:Uncharacterized protein n=1 Tax=Thecamonas trahens ATCC 50062 TaxID=461836 RepID=A0A0L0DQN7_THETB|nr:hypothetical protein AMSG_09463 [Thecamonas trahens ATCC 50062]KNC53748.1 hypothetical protein AMSG_09463 [Thecamonas trahens ATCC 50062]|eukprot:XP_013754311.1 hypothetical protein AMSG_09463 [Thecamonas trahens ATCC 50062]
MNGYPFPALLTTGEPLLAPGSDERQTSPPKPATRPVETKRAEQPGRGKQTAREMELEAELRATRGTLREMVDEMRVLEDEAEATTEENGRLRARLARMDDDRAWYAKRLEERDAEVVRVERIALALRDKVSSLELALTRANNRAAAAVARSASLADHNHALRAASGSPPPRQSPGASPRPSPLASPLASPIGPAPDRPLSVHELAASAAPVLGPGGYDPGLTPAPRQSAAPRPSATASSLPAPSPAPAPAPVPLPATSMDETISSLPPNIQAILNKYR